MRCVHTSRFVSVYNVFHCQVFRLKPRNLCNHVNNFFPWPILITVTFLVLFCFEFDTSTTTTTHNNTIKLNLSLRLKHTFMRSGKKCSYYTSGKRQKKFWTENALFSETKKCYNCRCTFGFRATAQYKPNQK